ncbi:MAG TPA: thioredoxin family protein [Candidatus Polarisedimenticolaceae bacterium]|nr:thioredoxin family protein [Candidatus Polarisedimenticolaceae bacterium]
MSHRWTAAALLVVCAAAAGVRAEVPAVREAVPFIEDDYARAVSEARSRGVPVFADVWTVWCHTCQSMRAFVFTDRALERQAGRFVWLSIDAEREPNASFLEKYPVQAFPTLLVIDPQAEQAVFRWAGGATLKQLEHLLDDGERAFRNRGAGAEEALAKADRLAARQRNAEAIAAYREALAKAPAGWPQRDRAVESLLGVLSMSGANADCVSTAQAELNAERGIHLALVVTAGLDCALSLEADKSAAVARFEAAARSVVGEPRIEMAADDRSGLYELWVHARSEAQDEPGAKQVAAEWLSFLEGEAARAPTPQARAVFDPHRLSAALAAGEPARAIEPLRQSERDFPQDYNPPARLSIAYREAGRIDDALAAADRALGLLAYGPRKLRLYTTKADALEMKGDTAAVRATLEEALRYARTLPRAQFPKGTVAGLEARLAKL